MRLPTLSKVEGKNAFTINWSRYSAPSGAKLEIRYPNEKKAEYHSLNKPGLLSQLTWKTGTKVIVFCNEDHFDNCIVTIEDFPGNVIEKKIYQGEQSFNNCYFFPQKDYEKVIVRFQGENNKIKATQIFADSYKTETFTSIPSDKTETYSYSTILYPGKVRVTMKLTYGNEILEDVYFFDYNPTEDTRSILSCDSTSPIDNRSFIKYSWENEEPNENSKPEWWNYSDEIDFDLNSHLRKSINENGNIDSITRDFNLTYGVAAPFKLEEDSEELAWSGKIADKFSMEEEIDFSYQPSLEYLKEHPSLVCQKRYITVKQSITTPEELALAVTKNYKQRANFKFEDPNKIECDTNIIKFVYSINSAYKVWNMNGFKNVKLIDFIFNPSSEDINIGCCWPCACIGWEDILERDWRVDAEDFAFCGTILGNNTILYNLHGCTDGFGALIPFVTGETEVSNLIIKNSYFNKGKVVSNIFSFPYEGVGGFFGAHNNLADSLNVRKLKVYNCGLINCIFDPTNTLGENTSLSGYLIGDSRWAEGDFSTIIIENCKFKDYENAMAYGGLVGAYQSFYCYLKSYSTNEFDQATQIQASSPLHYKDLYIVNSEYFRKGKRNLHNLAHPGWDKYPPSNKQGIYNPKPVDFNFKEGIAEYGEDKTPYNGHSSFCFDNSETLFGSALGATVASRVYVNLSSEENFFRYKPRKEEIDFFKKTQNSFIAPTSSPLTSKYVKKRISGEAGAVTLTTPEGQYSSIPPFTINPRANMYFQLPGETEYKPCQVYVRVGGKYVLATDIYVKKDGKYKKSY